MVKNLPFSAGGAGLVLGWGIKISHMQLRVLMSQLKTLSANQDPAQPNKQFFFFFKIVGEVGETAASSETQEEEVL